MRHYIKVKIKEIISEIDDCHAQIAKYMLSRDYGSVTALLCRCQELAEKTGRLIEDFEESSTNMISALEDYCEKLYQLSLRILSNSDTVVSENDFLTLNRCPSLISHYVDRVLPTEYEVVFFPYKASMWDSLESIWETAAKDPEAEVYVVPLPYYELNPDGSLGRIHDEISQYPPYVPVTSWKDYDIVNRRPDMVFIHNPYDESNRVTSVHPAYYASKLKKYASILVYVPYFICIQDVEDHFCTLPGVLYADRVIVQSEAVKKTYFRNMCQLLASEDSSEVRKALKEKFLALGSPKYDKILRTAPEKCSLPPSWLHLITGQNGRRKKIVLYNTSLTSLLADTELMLQKTVQVLKLFKSAEDIVLLWRPHPLSEATCRSLRPDLTEKYNRIVSAYRTEGWGIYDDTPDLNRAIAISDAYYGDLSSLVALYQLTGKPIMIQNPEILS